MCCITCASSRPSHFITDGRYWQDTIEYLLGFISTSDPYTRPPVFFSKPISNILYTVYNGQNVWKSVIETDRINSLQFVVSLEIFVDNIKYTKKYYLNNKLRIITWKKYTYGKKNTILRLVQNLNFMCIKRAFHFHFPGWEFKF